MKYSVELFFNPNPVTGKTEGIAFSVNIDLDPSSFEDFLHRSILEGAVPLSRPGEFKIIPRGSVKYINVRYKEPVENELRTEDVEFIVDSEGGHPIPTSMDAIEYG
jgi:hypothetical protein